MRKLCSQFLNFRKVNVYLIGMVFLTLSLSGKASNLMGFMSSGPTSLPELVGNIPPNGKLTLVLTNKRIKKGRSYIISCDISNSKYEKNNPVIVKMTADSSGVMGVSDWGFGRITLNGNSLNAYQAELSLPINKYEIGVSLINKQNNLNPRLFLRFENYDDSKIVIIRNCVAKYVV